MQYELSLKLKCYQKSRDLTDPKGYYQFVIM